MLDLGKIRHGNLTPSSWSTRRPPPRRRRRRAGARRRERARPTRARR
uniref:Uncharacterized protein n=1 Tax=Arundo donax TaxID=35708 RepID=A0A0A9GV57_ARUDO